MIDRTRENDYHNFRYLRQVAGYRATFISVFTAGITPRVPAFFWGMMANADIPAEPIRKLRLISGYENSYHSVNTHADRVLPRIYHNHYNNDCSSNKLTGLRNEPVFFALNKIGG
ncbi:hypothetical protein [Morganella morganii]|uniref:hypothetical protein n=1 Tax=Morganella morganii TaxID=582 RepID=UPI001881A868|nr:hypothetical protein [Morganella morganii]